MAEPTIQLGGGNWAGKSGNLLGYYEQNKKFYAEDFTFSRSTTGTYTDKDGYIQEMPYNLLQYSEDYSQIYWRKDKLTATANSATSPSGLTDAFLIQETTYTNSVPSFDLQSSNTLSVGTYTFSFYVKNNNGRYLGISFGSSGERVRTNFDFNTNTFKTLNLSGSTTGSASYTTLGDYYRISVTATFPSSVGADVVLMPLETDTYPFFAFQDSDNRSFYLWGVQLVKGTSAKTYFPTTTRLNMPRVDYLNNSNGSLILEPQRTNILVQSTNFSGGWALDDVTKVSDSTISPDGNTNAITLIGNTNASRHHIRQGAAGSVTASLSVFAKAKELRYLQIATVNTIHQYANFDVYDGTIGAIGSAFSDAKIEDYGNGWYRCSVTSTNQYNAMYISLVSSLNSSWLESWTMSNNTDGLYLYGAQLEQGSYATSYIPTSGSSVTRNADACTDGGDASRFNDNEGVLYAEIAALEETSSSSKYISISDETYDNRLSILFSSGATDQIRAFLRVGGVSQVDFNKSVTDVTDYNKVAFKYKANDFALWINGVEVATDVSGSVFSADTLTKLSFSEINTTSNKFEGKVKDLKVYNTALSDTELATLTTL